MKAKKKTHTRTTMDPEMLRAHRESVATQARDLALRPPKETAEFLRKQIAFVRELRRTRIAKLRAEAKAGIAIARAKYRDRKERIFAALKANRERDILRIHEAFEAQKRVVEQSHSVHVEMTRALKLETEAHRRRLKEAHNHHAASHARVKAAARMRERKGEHIEEARRNVEAHHPEMLPYFDSVAQKLKHTKTRSRTEHFYQLAHDNPEAVILASQRAADKALHAAVKHDARTWENRAKAVEAKIVERAHRDFAKGRPFRLKDSEKRILASLGIDAEELEMRAYRPAKRMISARRGAETRGRSPF